MKWIIKFPVSRLCVCFSTFYAVGILSCFSSAVVVVVCLCSTNDGLLFRSKPLKTRRVWQWCMATSDLKDFTSLRARVGDHDEPEGLCATKNKIRGRRCTWCYSHIITPMFFFHLSCLSSQLFFTFFFFLFSFSVPSECIKVHQVPTVAV